MESKLEALINGQKRLEERISNIEKLITDNDSNNNNNNSIDPDYVKVCVICQI
jgi:hypothetical protein